MTMASAELIILRVGVMRGTILPTIANSSCVPITVTAMANVLRDLVTVLMAGQDLLVIWNFLDSIDGYSKSVKFLLVGEMAPLLPLT